MESSSNKLIRWSSLILLFFGLVTLNIDLNSFKVVGVLYLILGIFLLAYSFLTVEELKQKKSMLILLAIILTIINFISGILLIIAISEIGSNKNININGPPTNMVSSESKTIDILLKIGLGMVMLSGVLLATTNWEAITNLVKVLILVILGILFIILSIFSEKKLKIKSTTKVYFILGLVFFVCSWIATCYFGIISDWLKFGAKGSTCALFTTIFLTNIMIYISYFKFKTKEYLYLGNIVSYFSLYYLLITIIPKVEYVLLIISIMTTLINLLIKNKKDILDINYIVSYALIVILLFVGNNASMLVVLLASIVNLFNVLFLSFKTNIEINHVLSTIGSYILILFNVLRLEEQIKFNLILILFSCLTLLFLIIRYNNINKSKATIITNNILYYFSGFGALFALSTSDNLIHFFIAALIYFIVILMSSFDFNKLNDKMAKYYLFIPIFFLISSLVELFSKYVYAIDTLFTLAIANLVFILCNYLTKDKSLKTFYYVLSVLSSVFILRDLGSFFDIFNYVDDYNISKIFISVITLFVNIYLYIKATDYKNFVKVITYILILLNISLIFNILYNDIINFPSIVYPIMLLITYGILIFLTDSKPVKITSYISILYPIYLLISEINMSPVLYTIIWNIMYVYVLFLILKLLVKDNKTKDVLNTVFLSLILFSIFFNESIYIGGYIGIVSLTLMLLVFNKKEFKASFYSSIVIFILNLLYRLLAYWSFNYFWIYLLVAGILIIVFVMVKESKESKNKIEENKVQVLYCGNCGSKINNQDVFCSNCGAKIKKEQ